MNFGLNGKVALVAGGSRGCGLAISKELAEEGASVVLTGREPDIVSQAVEVIKNEGGRAHGVVGGMVTQKEADRLVGEATEVFHTPDILVVNPPTPGNVEGFLHNSDEDYLAAHENYTMSLVRLSRLVIPAMQERRWGRIIAMASIGVKTPHLRFSLPAQNTRVASAAVAKTMSYEFAKDNITVNTIATGPFPSALSDEYNKSAGYAPDRIAKSTPMGRLGRTEEMAAIVAFLCSDRASFVSGETIRVDGGSTLNLF
jgi:3-oxoacyl-[acyl-carrier protein] reductase